MQQIGIDAMMYTSVSIRTGKSYHCNPFSTNKGCKYCNNSWQESTYITIVHTVELVLQEYINSVCKTPLGVKHAQNKVGNPC